MKKTLHAFTSICAIAFTCSAIQAQITAYPDTAVCAGEPVTLYADAANYCGDCYIYHAIPYAIEPIGGTAFSMLDDTHTDALDIGFTFCFFGNDYTQFYLNANGWISFDEPTEDMDVNWTPDDHLPSDSADIPKNAIFGPWTDWNPGMCTDCLHYETTGVAPYRKCVITWDEVPLYVCYDFTGTFQIVLYETTNEIYNHFGEVDVCNTWDSGFATQGTQDIAGDIAFTVDGRNATVWSAENESWQWNTSDIKWYKGAVPIGSGTEVTVSPLEATTYTVVQTLCDGTEYTDDVTVDMLISGCDTVITTDCDPITDMETLTVDTISASITWNTADAAEYYIVQYKQETALSWNIFTVTDTSALLSDLEECTSYIYRIGYICLSDTIFSTETIIFTTDCIDDIGAENNTLFTIAPNPADDHFILHMNGQNKAAYSLILYNTYGEKILEKNIIPGITSIIIPLDNLITGPYILRLQNDCVFVNKILIIK